MDDVPIIDNMAPFIVRYSLAALQRDDWCGAQKTFKPIIKDAYTQAMTDQVIPLGLKILHGHWAAPRKNIAPIVFRRPFAI
jgi:hypothetical protein